MDQPFRSRRASHLALAALVCTGLVPADAQAVDCRVRDIEAVDPSWTCQSAAQLMSANVDNHGGDESFRCVPASAFASWGCLELDTDARLCADGATFNASVYLTQSDVSLDCAGQTLRPRGGKIGNSERSGIRTPYSYSVHDITISDCQIVDASGYGIDLKRLFRDDEPCLTAPNAQEINKSNSSSCRDALLQSLSLARSTTTTRCTGQWPRTCSSRGIRFA